MSRDAKGQLYCDECGRLMAKAHRIDDGHAYCCSCYPHVFRPRPCSRCATSTRAHRHAPDEAVVCRACVRATRQCLRCEKPLPRAALAVGRGYVCGPCTRYFTRAKPCGGCGVLSVRLLRLPRFGLTEPRCDRCRNQITHRTCGVCRRYRPIHGMDAAGAYHCRTCVPGAEQVHPCPSCGSPVPGSGQGACRACLHTAQLSSEARLLPLTLEHAWAQTLYADFATWLHHHAGGRARLAAQYRMQAPFFERLDALYPTVESITATSLLTHFEVAALRRHLLVMRFLQFRLGLVLTPAAKHEAVERSRVHEALLAAKRTPWHGTLVDYVAWLRDAGTATRTMRLYVSSAAHLHAHAKRGDDTIDSRDVLHYLRTTPGARANLFRYLTFGRQTRGWEARLPTSTKPRPDPAQRLSALLQRAQRAGIEHVASEVLERILCTAFAIRVDRLRRSRIEAGGRVLQLNREGPVAVPPELHAIAAQWARRRA